MARMCGKAALVLVRLGTYPGVPLSFSLTGSDMSSKTLGDVPKLGEAYCDVELSADKTSH
jgi:hypothetical protein